MKILMITLLGNLIVIVWVTLSLDRDGNDLNIFPLHKRALLIGQQSLRHRRRLTHTAPILTVAKNKMSDVGNSG